MHLSLLVLSRLVMKMVVISSQHKEASYWSDWVISLVLLACKSDAIHWNKRIVLLSQKRRRWWTLNLKKTWHKLLQRTWTFYFIFNFNIFLQLQNTTPQHNLIINGVQALSQVWTPLSKGERSWSSPQQQPPRDKCKNLPPIFVKVIFF